MFSKIVCLLFALTLIVIGFPLIAAQEERIEREIIIQSDDDDFEVPAVPPVPPVGAVPPVPGNPPVPAEDTFVFISSEMDSGETVKNAPYSAESISEQTQNLPDGNRIVNRNTTKVYRDSDGRTRREHLFGAIGPWTESGKEHKSVFINDPVAKYHYILDSDRKSAHKIKVDGDRPFRFMKREFHGAPPVPPAVPGAPPTPPASPGKPDVQREVIIHRGPPPPHGAERRMIPIDRDHVSGDAKTESLGKKIIEGVSADGTRTVRTIAPGKIGNEKAINIVTEKWYSEELKANVLTKHVDPRFGESTYRLENIQRSEPDPSLFKIPTDYKIEKDSEPRIRIEKEEREVD